MNKLLIVDDEIVIAMDLEERLSEIGYQVVGTASSGREAVSLSHELAPDLVLMDIVMPGEMDGIAAAERIRDETDIPFIFTTAYADRELIDRAKSVLPLGYIIKPFCNAQITAAVEVALHNSMIARKLRESEDRYRELVELVPHGILEVDLNSRITFANSALHYIFECPHGEMKGRSISDILHREETPERHTIGRIHDLNEESMPCTWVRKGVTLKGKTLDIQIDWNYKKDSCGNVIGFIGVVTDIKDRINSELLLCKTNEKLEKNVIERTKDLLKANLMLKKEIEERRKAEEELRVKRSNLEEVNTALKVLLKKREETKKDLEDRVLLNMKELAFPYMQKLRLTELNPVQEALIGIIESNLQDIISPFSQRLSSRFWNFTPTELKIANLIRQGITTKEISSALNLSPKTVETHRKNIRSKLGISGKKLNLRSHLLSIQ